MTDAKIATCDLKVVVGVVLLAMVQAIDKFFLEILPPYISVIASYVALYLAIVVLRNHLLNRKKMKLEVEILEDQIKYNKGLDVRHKKP